MLKQASKIFLSIGLWGSAVSGLLIYKYSGYPADRLVMGNYSGYISPSVNLELTSKYGLQTDYFDYDHSVKSRFEKGVYDMSVVTASTLLEMKEVGLLKKIDWKKLDLKYLKNNTKKSMKNRRVSLDTAEKAQRLFTDAVQEVLKTNTDFLDYGIPYFVNTLGFYYRGSKISELEGEVDFKKLVEVISKEERFKSKNGMPQLALIDDPRTVLSLARLVDEKDSINPSPGEYSNHQDIFKTFQSLQRAGLSSEKMGPNFLFLNPNSSTLVDALASKTVAGAFMYNGDGLFALNGGTMETDVDDKEFHMVKLKQDVYFVDFVVLSSRLQGTREERAYKLAKELLFKGMLGKREKILDQQDEGEGEYKHAPLRNFDYVQYTPVLKREYQQINEEYFEEDEEVEEGEESAEEEGGKSELQKKILQVKKSAETGDNLKKYYEQYLDPKTKSDMFIAYENFKLSL